MTDTLVAGYGLMKHFKVKRGMLHAVDGIDFDIPVGKTLGVVGESGCGKSTLGRLVLGLHSLTAGRVLYEGKDTGEMSVANRRQARREMQMIFQDPYSSLNPRMSVETLIAQPMIVNRMFKTREEMKHRVRELMDTVGLAQRLAGAYPHELDGGRRQRIGVARVLAMNPRFVVCDEPVSALDVSIQAQILNLLMDLQEEFNLSYMFITHDLSVVRHISDEIMVMYMGVCVEKGVTSELFTNPLHPYTQALLSAILEPEYVEGDKAIEALRGEVTNPINPLPGCRFAPRCEFAEKDCLHMDYPLNQVGEGHWVACRMFPNSPVKPVSGLYTDWRSS